MSCSPFDLKDYFFGELSEAERAGVREHLEGCSACREELERLELTRAALHSVRDEEPPRRIAFVSDRVFEPRWWEVLWNSGPRLGFASAALLAAAIVFHTFAARPVPQIAGPSLDSAVLEARVSAEVARRLQPAIAAAVAQAEQRQSAKAVQLVDAVRKDFEWQRQADRVAFEETLTLLQKKYNTLLIASSEPYGGRP